MNTKLTLSLDKVVIEKAKHYAKDNGYSLSELVLNYFKLLTVKKYKNNIEITPLVKSMKIGHGLPADFDEKQALIDALSEKYN